MHRYTQAVRADLDPDEGKQTRRRVNLMRRRWFVLMLLCGTLGSREARGQTDGAALEKWREILKRWFLPSSNWPPRTI